MRTCPVCKARCFDDMEVCYGCMHRFSEQDPDDFGKDAEVQEPSAKTPPKTLPVPVKGEQPQVSLVKSGERLAPVKQDGPNSAALPLRQELELAGGFRLVLTVEPLAGAGTSGT